MKILRTRFFNLSKRQKFVASAVFLSVLFFSSEYFSGFLHLGFAVVISLLTTGLLYLILRKDSRGVFTAPIYILPFLYTLSFSLFYLLIPERFFTMVLSTVVFIFGLYSLFLTQNIFALSSVRTINLLRSARIVSFVLTLVVVFFFVNIFFSLHFPAFVVPFFIFVLIFLLSFQSLWVYSLDKERIREIVVWSLLISLMIMELSFMLILWPVSASVYSIFLTGIFYTYLGLSHTWIEKRLFKGILWEYVWVGFLSIFILLAFSRWV